MTTVAWDLIVFILCVGLLATRRHLLGNFRDGYLLDYVLFAGIILSLVMATHHIDPATMPHTIDVTPMASHSSR
jgi:hypothetical protein